MVISGYTWLSVVISGYQWLYMVISDYQWLSVVISGYTWLSMNSELMTVLPFMLLSLIYTVSVLYSL